MSMTSSLSRLSVGMEDAAEMTGTTRDAIYRALTGGELQSFKIGRRRLILVEELERWVKRKAQEHTEEAPCS